MNNHDTTAHHFASDREALDFVASQIADEAHREDLPLSEVERKMLYFSETAWTLPDIWEVSDQFDRDCDQRVYEEKISRLIKNSVAHARKQHEFDSWTAALRRLGKDDRYLLVMIRQAGMGRTLHHSRRLGKWVRMLATVIVALILFAGFTWLLERLHPVPGGYSPRGHAYISPLRETLSFSIWAFPVFLLVVHGIFRVILGAGKISEIDSRITEWIFGVSTRGR